MYDTDKAFTLATQQDMTVVMGVDFFNATITGDRVNCLRNKAADCDHVGG